MWSIRFIDTHRAIFYASALETIENRLLSSMEEIPVEHRPQDVRQALAPVLQSLAITCDQTVLPVTALEINTYARNIKGGQVDNGYSGYTDFFEGGYHGHPVYPYMQSKYSVLMKRLQRMLMNLSSQLTLAILRFARDIGLISNAWGANYGRLKEIRLSGDDRHNQSAQVLFFVFENSRTLVYKPSRLRTDKALADFLSLCRSEGPTVESIEREGYFWEKYIGISYLRTESDCKTYWYRAGTMLAAADLCDFSDGHFENVVATAEGPCIVDSETLCQHIRTRYDEGEEHSVLATGLIQSIGAQDKGWGLRAAYQVAGECVSEILYPHAVNERTLNLRVEMRGSRKTFLRNYPIRDGHFVSLLDYKEDFDRGLLDTYLYVIDNKRKILNDVWWGRYRNLSTRQILRDTLYYTLIERVSEQPNYAKDSFRLESMLHRYTDPVSDRFKAYAFLSQITDYERRALRRMDIPIFYSRIGDCDLIDGDGRRYRNFFPCSAVEQVRHRIARLDEAYAARQVEIVDHHMDLGIEFGRVPDIAEEDMS